MENKIVAIFVLCLLSIINCNQTKNKTMDWNTVYTEQGLEKVDTLRNSIAVHLRYSTEDNFVGKDVYGNLEEAYLQPEALKKLYVAAQLLTEDNPELKLLIWDAARPRRIQQILWDTVEIPLTERSQYVANPKSGSIHNYGCAVDLTLVDSSGNILDMGTGYDDFSKLAHIDKETDLVSAGELTTEQVEHRLLLRSVMTKAGFIPLGSEWWHFDAFSREETKSRFKIVE